VPRSLLTLRPNQTAPTAVPTKISIPLSPARYSFTTTGFEVTVNAPKALQAALCTECPIEAGHTLPGEEEKGHVPRRPDKTDQHQGPR
jgi:hypothetical protein